MTVLHLAQIRLFVLLSLLSHLRFWQPPFPTDAYERQPRGPGSAVRNRTGGNAQLDAARRGATGPDFNGDDPTVPVAWVMGRLLRCKVLRVDVSRSMSCLIRRDGPRYEPSSRQSARRPPASVTRRFQSSLEELYRRICSSYV